MDGISINPFIYLAVAQKLSALQTYEIIAERAKGASLSSVGSSVFAAGMAGLRVKSCDSFPMPSNVLGTALQCCCASPVTGFYRDGFCRTGPEDVGLHTVCVVVTAGFLDFGKSRGNDLITPRPEYGFPGLKPGDKWCVCVRRWAEAFDAGVAPKVCIEATHISALEFVDLEDLKQHAVE